MNINKKVLSYINKKDKFTITEIMAEFQISYASANEVICVLKGLNNVEQINDFDYRVCDKKSSAKKSSANTYDRTEDITLDFEKMFEDFEDDETVDFFVNSDDEKKELDDKEEELDDKTLEEEEKIFENKCMDMIEKIMLSDKLMTREGAIKRSKEIIEVFEMLDNEDMVNVSKRVAAEFELASDAEFELLKEELYRADDRS